MGCAKYRQQLSPYLDNELSPDERGRIMRHVESCRDCSRELTSLRQQHLLFKSVRPITPSPRFRAGLWQKVRALERGNARAPSLLERILLRWIPVPVALSIGIMAFSAFSAAAPAVYGTSNRTAGSLASGAAKALAGQRSVLSPVNFARFCDRCHSEMCEACLTNPSKQCPMGGE